MRLLHISHIAAFFVHFGEVCISHVFRINWHFDNNYNIICVSITQFWLRGRKGIRPVKNWVVGCWCSYLSGARCRLAYGPADATTVSCFSKIQIAFTFLVPTDPGSPGQRAVKRVCVCVLLPNSNRFRYLDHLAANRMTPSMCPDPCGTRWGSWV